MRIRPPEFENSICDAKYHVSLPPLLSQTPPPPCAAAARLRRKFVSGQFDEENPFVLISSVLLVQADEGVSFLVVDRIGDIYHSLPRRADVIVTTVGARHKCQQGSGFEPPMFRIGRKIKTFHELATGRRRPPHAHKARAHGCAYRVRWPTLAQTVALLVTHGRPLPISCARWLREIEGSVTCCCAPPLGAR
ncbi:hypothetical protein F511_10165 [Dorcoceras hygrometricum]|uniref:Uncharacterized protein n=1 Tax=Dorcoceras hygrometricum TaxID=472368 RepID=A0A2Z7B2L4_9LAMI|nr:hypothetical protein F511_10165 [Dorcoceras hygrometricum]